MAATEIGTSTKMHSFPCVFVMESRLEDGMVNDLNGYLDRLVEDQQRQSHAGKLVGQIKQGEQLTIDANDPQVIELSKLLCRLSENYVEQFYAHAGFDYQEKRTATIDAMWSVHSFAGDYNPIHDHATTSRMGISTVLWTKVPDEIRDRPVHDQSLNYSSGSQDGYLHLHFGATTSNNMLELRPWESWAVKPEVGRLVIFPCWLKHMVYPFTCSGERRTVASNLNLWSPKAMQRMMAGAPNRQTP